MISLRVQSNASTGQVTLAKLVGIGLAMTRGVLDLVPLPLEPTTHDKGMMPMDNPGKVHTHPDILTTPLLKLPGSGLVRPTIFANNPTPTTKLTKDITSGAVCPGNLVRKPIRACGSDPANLSTLAMRPTMLIHIRSSVATFSQIQRLRSITGRHHD